MPGTLILAVAGAGKSTDLIRRAADPVRRSVLIVTFTINNADSLRRKMLAAKIPGHVRVRVMTWWQFLLQEAIRPYQSCLFSPFQIKGHVPAPLPLYAKKTSQQFWITSNGNIYQDRVGALAHHLQGLSGGKVVDRLARMYDTILIDEVQDLGGADLHFVRCLMESPIQIIAVGDPYQHVYTTSREKTGRKYVGHGLPSWAHDLKKSGVSIELEEMEESHRCSEPICEFATRLTSRRMISLSSIRDGHCGIFFVSKSNVDAYIAAYTPAVLRWNRTRAVRTSPSGVYNFGEVKGLEFFRVLIYPTAPIVKYLWGGEYDGDVAKFYVAVTRAKASVAFVIDRPNFISPLAEEWTP